MEDDELKVVWLNSSLNNGYNLETNSTCTETVYMYTGAGFTMMSNFFFVLIVFCKKKYRTPANFMLVYLSLWSGVSMIINILRIMMYREVVNLFWFQMTNGNFTCRFWVLLHRTSLTAIALSTMAISEERIRIIRNPLIKRSKKHHIKRMLFGTLYSLLVSIPVVFAREYDASLFQQFRCRKITIGGSVVLSSLLAVWQISTTTLIPAIKLVYEHWKTRYQIKYLLTTEGRLVLTEDRRQQLFLTSCVFSMIFLFCWVPYGILVALKDLPSQIFTTFELQNRVSQFYKAARNLVLLHIALNPLLFIVLNYRWTFKGFFRAVTSS